MTKRLRLLSILTTAALCVIAAAGQTGGDFAIKKGAVTSGGGATTDTADNTYGVFGVVAQPVAGPAARNGLTGVSSGILSGHVLPSAAGVSISGRVMTPNGRGLLNAVVTVTGPDGATRNAMTTVRGNFRFDDVATGQTYVISVRSRRFSFTPQIVSVTDNVTGIDFIGQ